MLHKLILSGRGWIVFLHDLLWVPIAITLAFWLRFNMEAIPGTHLDSMWVLIAFASLIQAASFSYFGLYRGLWRFASLPDLMRLTKAVVAGTAVTFLILFLWYRAEGIPRSVIVLYPMLLMAGLAVPRIFYRGLKDHRFSLLHQQHGKHALIVGAGRAGELLVRDLLKDAEYLPVAFLDDDQHKHGKELHGIRVVADTLAIQEQIQSLDVEVVLLAIPSASSRVIRTILDGCTQAKVPCRMLPSLPELASGKVEVASLREIHIEDLLGRAQIEIDDRGATQFIANQCVLITGAGGSIGSELCRQIKAYHPSRMLMLDHGEFNLYRIDQEITGSTASDIYIPVLGDIRDESRLRWVFTHFKPDIIFNAAAYKHVPLVEQNPAEGVKTNVLGTCCLADLAVEYGCGKFIQISTDKAVNPTNVMGASKRTAEIYCQNMNLHQSKTVFITTRFGNVLGSTGSVVPLFRRQIEAGGPVTVTHPDITRYFMTIPEAVSLILQAGSMGNGGEIFVLDMGEPVKIADMAAQMIHLSGMEPGKDIEITYTGLRPGEKLYEELFHEHETLGKTDHPKIMLSASRVVDWKQMRDLLMRLQQACKNRECKQVQTLLKEIVPEFCTTGGENEN